MKKLYERFYNRVGFRLKQTAAGRDTLGVLNELERVQGLPRDEIRALQLSKLQYMLKHAACHVPYYREKFSSLGLDVSTINSLEEFAKRVPLLDKQDVRSNRRAFVADKVNEKLPTVRTGGSTGEPLLFYRTPTMAAHQVAQMIKAQRWWGIEIGDRSVKFWGHSASFSPGMRGRLKKLFKPIKDRINNCIVFSAYGMSLASMERYYHRMRNFRPRFIIGYASTIYVFAEHLYKHGWMIDDIGIKAVITTAEVLYDWQRVMIEKVFKAPVVIEYGMSEVGIIAYECPAGRIHTCDDDLLVETVPLLDDAASEPIYEIVITSLYNSSTPLIRYRTGDVVDKPIESSTCSCKLGLSVIENIRGRSHDLIVTPSGQYVHGEFFTHIFDHVEGVERFQIVQQKLDHILIKIAKNNVYNPKQERL